MDYTYDINEKDKCWYLKVCDKSRCGDDFCVRHYKMSCLISMACMEGKQRYPIPLKLDADKADKDAYDKLRVIQDDIYNFVTQGKNLLIYSKYTGNGKTEWAKKLMLSWFNAIWSKTDFECRGLFVSLPKLLSSKQSNIDKPNEYYNYVVDNIIKADLVVWDELNYKKYNEFEHSFILDILSQRMALGKANIYTTNYGMKEIQERLGQRLMSRVVAPSIHIEFVGKDKRELEV